MISSESFPLPVDTFSQAVWTEIRQVAGRNGFHKCLDHPQFAQGWHLLRSTLTPFCVQVAACGRDGPWILSFTEPRINTEMLPGDVYVGSMPGQSGRLIVSLAELGDALSRIFHLVTEVLPPSPYQEFLDATQAMPATTEAERTAIVRTAQGIFRRHLDRHWNHTCAITGVQDRELLRASHIKPWAASSAYERLAVHNGLLLSALWDAAFDQGLVSFGDEGKLLVSPKLSERAIAVLTDGRPVTVAVSAEHAPYLKDHRLRHGFAELDS